MRKFRPRVGRRFPAEHLAPAAGPRLGELGPKQVVLEGDGVGDDGEELLGGAGRADAPDKGMVGRRIFRKPIGVDAHA